MSKQQPEVWKQKLLIALEKSMGIVTPACKEVGISRDRFYHYYNTDEEFKKSVDEIYEMQGDFVETQLFKNIAGGDRQSILFYLKYRGKNRGYTNSIEISGGGEPIQIKYIMPENDNDDNKDDSEKMD